MIRDFVDDTVRRYRPVLDRLMADEPLPPPPAPVEPPPTDEVPDIPDEEPATPEEGD